MKKPKRNISPQKSAEKNTAREKVVMSRVSQRPANWKSSDITRTGYWACIPA